MAGRRAEKSPAPPEDANLKRDLQRIRNVLLPFLAASGLGIFLYVVATTQVSSALSGLGYSLAVAAAAMAFGTLMGFLFGIPKMLQGTGAPATAAAGGGQGPAAGATLAATPGSVTDNTNLEQISDWLTKLLIGASLTQLGKIAELVGTIAEALAKDVLPASRGAKPFFAAVVVFWSIAGFFVGYLLTRRVLPLMWHNATHWLFGDEMRAEIDGVFRARSQGKDAKITDAVRDLSRARIEDVPDTELTTWGRAQLLQDDYVDALSAFEKVLARSPDDRDAAEGLMFAALYLSPPRGFEKTLAEGERISNRTAAMRVYLAAAYGQKYRWLLSVGARPETDQLKDVRRRALEEAKGALDADPTWKEAIAGMLTATEGDDDLSAFRDDPDFKNLVA